MTVAALDHVNIRTGDVAATVAFFAEVLEMTLTPPPGADGIGKGAWLLDGEGRPIIHVGAAAGTYPSDLDFPFAGGDGTGPIHHVALRCEGPDAVRERLIRSGRRFTENHVDSIGLRQIFVAESNGILLELNFFAS